MQLHHNDVTLHHGAYFDWSDIEANSHMKVTDVANGLASTARYAGQLDGVYNVAQHSVLVAMLLEELHPGYPQMHYAGLMHDATESLMGDVTSPLKKMLPDYQAMEARLHAAMANWFGFHPTKYSAQIRYADLLALAIEKNVLLYNRDRWACLEQAEISPSTLLELKHPLAYYLSKKWDFAEARSMFVAQYHKYYFAGAISVTQPSTI